MSLAATRIVIKDVLVGEVWHASRQSNMVMTVTSVLPHFDSVRTQVAAANLPAIRFRRISEPASAQTRDDLRAKSDWVVYTPASAPSFAASAFFFGCRLHAEWGVPLAVIDDDRISQAVRIERTPPSTFRHHNFHIGRRSGYKRPESPAQVACGCEAVLWFASQAAVDNLGEPSGHVRTVRREWKSRHQHRFQIGEISGARHALPCREL